ncbi:MAG: hypothetical protein P1U46_04215, partial [Patescibacteria group bacterium]|nr:hypothetical protein [Patescibacteria group bacterium]
FNQSGTHQSSTFNGSSFLEVSFFSSCFASSFLVSTFFSLVSGFSSFFTSSSVSKLHFNQSGTHQSSTFNGSSFLYTSSISSFFSGIDFLSRVFISSFFVLLENRLSFIESMSSFSDSFKLKSKSKSFSEIQTFLGLLFFHEVISNINSEKDLFLSLLEII